METTLTTALDVLATATDTAGLTSDGAELIRDGSNLMYKLAGDVVARISPPGSAGKARKELAVSRWLADRRLPAVEALEDVPQPVTVDERPVTWWKLLPAHRSATPAELGGVLRRLHALPEPDSLELPDFDPFHGLEQRINAATGIAQSDHDWLTRHLADLRTRYRELPMPLRHIVIHGDAWQGNVAVTESGDPILLDLEDTAWGGPDNDLIAMAVDYTDFARLTESDYRSFTAAYGGHDVVNTPGYRTLADIKELRWLSFVLGKASVSAEAAEETRHRIACLRGEIPRPWTWNPF